MKQKPEKKNDLKKALVKLYSFLRMKIDLFPSVLQFAQAYLLGAVLFRSRVEPLGKVFLSLQFLLAFVMTALFYGTEERQPKISSMEF